MGVSNLDLSKLLLSPHQGMDLKKGVPESEGRGEANVLPSFEKHLTKASVTSKAADISDRAKETAPEASKANPKATRHSSVLQKGPPETRNVDQKTVKDDSSDASEASRSNIDESSADKNESSKPQDESLQGSPSRAQDEMPSDVSSILSALAAQNFLNPIQIRSQGDEEVSENKGEPKEIGLSQGESKLFDVLDAEVALKPSVQKPEQSSDSARTQLSKELLKNEDTLDPAMDSELKSLVNKPESKTTLNDFLHSGSSIVDSSDSSSLLGRDSLEPKAPSLKSMVDRLYVESKLEGQVPSQPMLLSTPQKVEVSGASIPNTVRSQLVSDLKPLISQVMRTQSGGEMTLSLRPADLGLVRVDLKVDSGDVKVAIHAEQSDARHLLQGQVHELKDQLTNAGLKVQEVTIHSMKMETSEQGRQQAFHQQHNSRDGSSNFQRQSSKERDAEQFEDHFSEDEQRRKVA
jgi:flagellar hook-length control protein FliK